MTLNEFHSMVQATMNLQSNLAQNDQREIDDVEEWYEEFDGILKNNVEEAAEEEVDDDD